MAKKKNENAKSRRIANFSSVIMVLFLSGTYLLETWITETEVNYFFAGLTMVISFFVVISIIRNSINHHKMAFNVPLAVLVFYTILMEFCNWNLSYYLFVCLALCVISCLYSSFNRTVMFIVVQNIFVIVLFFRGAQICGPGVPVFIVLINWVICLFSSLIMLVVNRAATVKLTKALEEQHSFYDLLESTENYVGMINERNEIVYASNTMAQLANSKEASLIYGRPFVDLFPGRSLKIFAGKLLREKENYAGDWEFSLNGQKRYFKAVSQSLRRGGGGSLINLYDMTHLAERDEIAAMKDSMKIGLFFMDRHYIIQDHYSRFLEEMLSETNLFGRLFTDVIADSVSSNELEAIKDYFKMVLERSLDQDMLEDINPLNELHYVNVRTSEKKVFQCTFSTIERDRGEVFLLVTVYDITVRVELQQRLAEEEARRQEEMQAVFELINVEPGVFNDFIDDMEHEFESIDKVFKNEELSAHDVLVKIYQSVHAIKSNAVILGLNVFGNKVHKLESKIKKLREMGDGVPFAEMLNLAMDIEKIGNEKEGFREIIEKLKSHTGGSGGGSGGGQNVKVLIDSLNKAATRVAEDMEKQVKFISSDLDHAAIDNGPRREMKEILVQLIRNSVVHGIEEPDVRQKKGKNETGTIKLSIKVTEDNKYIHIKLSDDGKGLDYKRIAERALKNKLIKEEDAENKDLLMKVIFSPGFSTAATEGIHGGRGIGLNLVRDRVKEVSGTIKLRSEADKGTLFFIAIPLRKQN